MDRRELLKGALWTAAAGVAVCGSDGAPAAEPTAAEGAVRPWDVVDTNVSLFQWPFRRLPYDATAELVARLRELGIQQAWAGSFEGLLQRDLRGVNARLAEACHSAPDQLLVPFGSINPTLPDWESDLRRCHAEHRMPGIRLHPGYHGYTLADERFAHLLDMAAARNLLVQIAVSLEDTRTQHAAFQVADVDLAPLPALLEQLPQSRVMLLNAKPRGAAFDRLAAVDNLVFDTARVEGTDGIARLMQAASPRRVVLGSHAPFLILESALIKVYESHLNETEVGLLLAQNARRLVSPA